MIFRPVWEMASTIRSGSFHWNSPLFLTSMFRHSKRCLTQWKPPSRASCKSRAVVAAFPHKKTCTAGSMTGTRAPGRGDGAGAADACGDTPGFAATAELVGFGGALLEHATVTTVARLNNN